MLEADQRHWRELATAEPIRIPWLLPELFAAHLAILPRQCGRCAPPGLAEPETGAVPRILLERCSPLDNLITGCRTVPDSVGQCQLVFILHRRDSPRSQAQELGIRRSFRRVRRFFRALRETGSGRSKMTLIVTLRLDRARSRMHT